MADDADIIDLRTNLASGRGSVVDFSAARHVAFPGPDFLVGDGTDAFLRHYFSQDIVLGTSLYRIKDASVTAEGVIFTDGQFNSCNELNIYLQYAKTGHRGTIERLPGLRTIPADDPVVLLTGPGHLVYGHWLVDFLPKLYLLDRAGLNLRRLTFLMPADTPGFAREWLRLLGIEPRQFLVYDRSRDVVACRELIVPTALRFGSRASPLFKDAANFLRKRIEGRTFRKAPARRRIFVCRTANPATLNPRMLVQRLDYEAKARARGFEVVKPETLSIPDQVRLFASAGTICGEYGSGLHGSMFSGPDTVVMAARDNGIGLGFLQSGLDQTLGHANGYVIGGATEAGEGTFSVRDEDMDMSFDWLDMRKNG